MTIRFKLKTGALLTRLVVFAFLAALVGLAGSAVALTCDPDASITRVTTPPGGPFGSYYAQQPAISADGRYIAFRSSATNLVPNDTNGVEDIFVYDQQTCQMERVSLAAGGVQANDYSSEVSLSGDGNLVLFTSAATNLVSGDTNNQHDIFIYNRATDQISRVLLNTFLASIARNGTAIVFTSYLEDWVSGDTNNTEDVFIYDLLTQQISRVSVASNGTQGNNRSYEPSVSADGNVIVFSSEATNLVAGDTNNAVDVFVHDRRTGQTRRVSVTSAGAQVNEASYQPDISADGRFVIFLSLAENLVSPGTTEREVFVHDLETHQTTLVSVSSTGVEGDAWTNISSISGDGRYVTFWSPSSNLVADDHNNYCDTQSTSPGTFNCFDVFVRDRQANQTVRLSVAANGTEGDGASWGPVISDSGEFVAFMSTANTLVSGDADYSEDVFVAYVPLYNPPQTSLTFVVTSTNDVSDGMCDAAHCSLREAINAANNHTGADKITFNIPGGGPYNIQPTAALPVITEPVTLDGMTQPGYTGTPIIQLDGSQAGLANGLWITAGNSTVSGLAINNFSGAGILLSAGGSNIILDNYIGTDVTGTLKRGNRDGVYILNSADNLIGGSNLISGNTDDGVNIEGEGATGNIIYNNTIGLSSAGQPLGNAGDGVKVSSTSSNNEISSNIIAANALNGVYLESGTVNPTGNYIARNNLYENALLGIDLGSDGVTLNDPGDTDSGPNGLQNFPVITSATANATSVLLYTTLNAAPNTNYTLHFYASGTCDPSGYGEAENFLGFAFTQTDANGSVTLGTTFVKSLSPGTVITVTATDPNSSTSELSACKLVEVTVITPTFTPTYTPSFTPTFKASPTPAPPSWTPTRTPTITRTFGPSPTYTPTPTRTPYATDTPSFTPNWDLSATPTFTASPTPAPPTDGPSPTPTPVTPSPTPPTTITGAPTATPADCAADDLYFEWGGFETFGLVRLTLTNGRAQPVSLANITVQWRQLDGEPGNPDMLGGRSIAGGSSLLQPPAAAYIVLRQMSAFAAPGLPGASVMWLSEGETQDQMPPTNSAAEGSKPAVPTFAAFSSEALYLDFNNTSASLDTLGIIPQDFAGSTIWLWLPGCVQAVAATLNLDPPAFDTATFTPSAMPPTYDSSPFPTDTLTPTSRPPVTTPTHTPPVVITDCSPGKIHVTFNRFEDFGLVKFDIVNSRSIPVLVNNFYIPWVQRGPGILSLARVNAFAPIGYSSSVTVWSALPGQDATPPTAGRSEGFWQNTPTIAAGNQPPLYVDFDGTGMRLDTGFGFMPADFAGAWFDFAAPGCAVERVTVEPPPLVTLTPTVSAPNAVPLRNYFRINRPTLTWNRIPGATAYEIQVDNEASFASPLVVSDVLNGATLGYTIPVANALPDGLYYWRVRAQTARGVWGGWSAADRFVVDALP